MKSWEHFRSRLIQAHFKYQSVKLKISEYEKLKAAVEISKEPMNGFLRSVIMDKVFRYVPLDETAPDGAEQKGE